MEVNDIVRVSDIIAV